MTERQPPVRLHLNENSAGCSPAVLTILHALTREDVGQYPDIDRATARVADHFHLAAENVVLTNGLDDGVYALARLARERSIGAASFEAIVVEPAFESYANAVESVGGTVRRVLPEPDFSFPTRRVLAAIGPGTALIFLNDPNNPTGQAIPSGAIAEIVRAAPRVLVLVDEAYADFRGRSIVGSPIAREPNVVVGRTFSKVYGLAGLRVGALLGQPDVIGHLHRRRPRFGVNAIAVRALESALADRDYYAASVAAAGAAKEAIYSWCRLRGLHAWPSETNFVLVRLGPEATAITAALAARGILITDRSSLPGCDGCVRISASRRHEVELALAALDELRAGHPPGARPDPRPGHRRDPRPD